MFGSLGKAIGLGTAKQTAGAALQGALRGAIMGQPFMGAAAGAMSSGRTEQGQSTGVSVSGKPADETSTSGSSDAQNLILNVNPSRPDYYTPASMIAPPLLPRNRSVTQAAGLPAIVGGAVTQGSRALNFLGLAGGAILVAPTIIDMVTGEEKKLRVTRRLRSQVKQAVQMFGAEVVAENMGTSVEVVFYILTKKMRNDGSYVTKAAVRKTRQTVRKMKHLCDMYDDLRPPARRATRARTTSKVMQIKN